MSDYSDYRVSQARSERAREQAARQRRMALLAAGALGFVVVLFALASSLRRAPAEPPRVVLTWPSPEKYGKRTFRGVSDTNDVMTLGQVLLRRNQPFSVALQNAQNWDATFVGAAPIGTAPGTAARWKPDKDGDALKIFVRPQTKGWRSLFAWAQPKQELRLVAREEKPLDANRRSVKMSTTPVWLSQNVATAYDQPAQWDQRAIPLLESAARAIPYRGPQPGPGRSMPLPPPRAPRWSVAQSFGDKRTLNDRGSYFDLNSADVMNGEAAITMTRLARHIAAREPEAGIKWIVKDAGSSNARATLRLEFDGSGARGGWVKNAGEREATPLRWWGRNLGEDDIRERLAPSPPRR